MTPLPKRNPVAILIVCVCLAWTGLCLTFWHCHYSPAPPADLPGVPSNAVQFTVPTAMNSAELNAFEIVAPTPAEQAIIDETLREWNRMTNR